MPVAQPYERADPRGRGYGALSGGPTCSRHPVEPPPRGSALVLTATPPCRSSSVTRQGEPVARESFMDHLVASVRHVLTLEAPLESMAMAFAAWLALAVIG